MLFAISLCDTTQRAILDDAHHGDVIAVVEAKDWQEARGKALEQDAMDAYDYRAGHGWFFKEAPTGGDNK